ncbi:MAG: regulatory iron-sulfur-containing complex subunit RicT [Rikenellaceae bacterium]
MSCNCKNRPNIGRGASFCQCHDEIEATTHEGCYKLHETDWLEEFPDNEPSDIFEIRFKNTRRSYYTNVNNLDLKRGDIVAVEASPGHDIGVVSLTGDMVARQMRRVGFNPHNGEFKKIYRKAKPYDIEKWQEAIELEHETMILSRQIAHDMGLNMKIGDVEYQGDKIKAIFYYIADERVDFRELIKVFADRFHIRIEMKQIGARQEAGRIGGLGACGRELCCASWVSNFTSVTTNAARVQEISLNPLKLAGQCSKLKCCLMYEYDTYVDARKGFPRLREPLQTMDGEFYLVKSDILAGTMAFSSSREAMANMVTLPVSRVKEILSLNRAGKKVDKLQRDEDVVTKVEEPTYRSEEDSITRFDNNKRRGGGNRNNRNKQRRAGGNGAGANGAPKESTNNTPQSTPQSGGAVEERAPRQKSNNPTGTPTRTPNVGVENNGGAEQKSRRPNRPNRQGGARSNRPRNNSNGNGGGSSNNDNGNGGGNNSNPTSPKKE